MRKIRKIITILSVLLILSSAIQCVAVYVSDGHITGRKTPTDPKNTELLWSLKLGTSYKNAPSPMIVVDDSIILMSKTTLYKLSTSDGSVIKKVEMVDTPSFSYTPVTYANGVIYCPLDNATIQAFSFKTMKSLWVYKDKLGGQSLTPISYSDGFIYTGFWNEEDQYANYVCIDVTDENKDSTNESKSAEWTYKSRGGFYWASCAFSGDCVIFGTDDGTVYDNKPSKVLSLKKSTGKLVDSISISGDQRSGITIYDGRAYFVTKAGYLYSVKLSNGKFDSSSLKKLSLGGASTSTPVIYNNRLYVGVQGDSFGKGSLKVVDSTKLSLIYSASEKGYPQNAVLVSDAYYKDTNKVYVYSTYNAPPGGLTVYTDSQGQTKGLKSELFTPESDKAGYGISSIVCDENGTLYYKNDSGYIFAVGNKKEKQKNQSFIIKLFNSIINFFKRIFGL